MLVVFENNTQRPVISTYNLMALAFRWLQCNCVEVDIRVFYPFEPLSGTLTVNI